MTTYRFTFAQAVRIAVVAVTAMMLFTACAGLGGASIGGTAWELESLAGGSLVPGTTITIEFTSTEVSGSAGCNHYEGTYRATGNSLSFENIFWTEMGCLEPAGIMAQEQTYLSTLLATASYEMNDRRLEIYDADGTTILSFVEKDAAP